MPSALKTLAILLLLALMPLRAVATVTVGFCATAHGEVAVAAHVGHGHGHGSVEHHGGDEAPAKSSAPSCSSCAEHCSSAAFAPATHQPFASPVVDRGPIVFAEGAAPAFFTDGLDRPPLA